MGTVDRLPWEDPIESDDEESALALVVEPEETPLRTMERQLEELKEIEEGLYKKSMRTVGASLDFMDVDPANYAETLEKWTLEVGEEEAKARLRVALANWQTAKDAPVGLKMAKDVSVALIKARATRESAPVHLNMSFVKMTVPKDILDALDVGDLT
jgi:hypothetical protein